MASEFTYEWDDSKAASNAHKHNVEFTGVNHFAWDSAITVDQEINDELRHFSLGLINGRLFALVWTEREDVCRIISLRKANNREINRWNNDDS